jgi:hypothetical protein
MRSIAYASAVLFCLWQSLYAQSTNLHEGRYEINLGKSYQSTVLIRHLDANTILFSIEAQKGPPSYNSGSLSGELKIQNAVGKYYSNEYETCHIQFTFSDKELKIEALEDESGCGFGQGVYVAGEYKRKTKKLSKKELESLR